MIEEHLPKVEIHLSLSNIRETVPKSIRFAKKRIKQAIQSAISGEPTQEQLDSATEDSEQLLYVTNHETGHLFVALLCPRYDPNEIKLGKSVSTEFRRAMLPLINIVRGTVFISKPIANAKERREIKKAEKEHDPLQVPPFINRLKAQLILIHLAGIATTEKKITRELGDARFSKWRDKKFPIETIMETFVQEEDSILPEMILHILHTHLWEFIDRNYDIIEILENFMLENAPIKSKKLPQKIHTHLEENGCDAKKWAEIQKEFDELLNFATGLLIGAHPENRSEYQLEPKTIFITQILGD